ncbi:MAG: Sialic acid TRAP transporter permease protein SiaT [Syntrophaceae bacterium PtaU1.Bin231]|nr:MAG: Sialic acid TRAP transporter permease protein SiaT [Syntrophaceae bacterium PtaU1.Bin231]
MILTLCLVFGILLLLGVPIAFTLGISAMVMLALYSPTGVAMVPDVMYNALDTFPLMALPFFVITAEFMVRGGSSRYLIDVANCLFKHHWGGLAIVTVVSCTFFGAICGSSVATAMAIGIIVVPAMMESGYPRTFSLGVVAAAGTIAIMIPPSGAMIIYGIVAEESIPRLFLAGFVPGVTQAILYILWIKYDSRRKNIARTPVKASWTETFQAVKKALPALSLPLIILGGIYTGLCTVTEAAGLSAVVAIFISVFVYREIPLGRVITVAGEAMRGAGMILFIISTAIVFGNWLTEAGLPARLVKYATDMKLNAFGFLLACNIILLFLGCFLEVVSTMLITLPILLPLVSALGIDLVHFGIMMTLNMEIALITPPVGLNLYVVSGVGKAPLQETIKGVTPYIVVTLIQLALVTYWPAYTLFVPNLLMPR